MGDDAARKRLGASGERLAAGWLEARGYRILARNWHCAYGEIDLIAERARDGALAFVEVKTRRGERLGAPEEAITPTKRRRLIASAQTYLAEHGAEGRPYGIDVIAVALEPSGRLRAIRHYPNSVEGEE
jgi:putative endonuclease